MGDRLRVNVLLAHPNCCDPHDGYDASLAGASLRAVRGARFRGFVEDAGRFSEMFSGKKRGVGKQDRLPARQLHLLRTGRELRSVSVR